MKTPRRVFGDRGELLAERELRKKGLQILERQYQTKGGEIDLIAKDGNEIVFVEVKTRQTHTFGYPEEAVTNRKIRALMRAVEFYLREHHLEETPWRMDVVAIEWGDPPHVEIIEGIGG
ncbi:MAG: YraN family protein [Patescibacteria group bacterium]|jgi:putative endonuclease